MALHSNRAEVALRTQKWRRARSGHGDGGSRGEVPDVAFTKRGDKRNNCLASSAFQIDMSTMWFCNVW